MAGYSRDAGRERRPMQLGRLWAACMATASLVIGRGARRWGLRLEKRHGKMELGALAYFALHPKATAVYLDKMLGNGQAQACATRFAGARHIDAVKALKDSRLVGLRDANAGV